MKRLLLAFLLVPALASAGTVISETWATYCDNGTEKLRASIVADIMPGIFFDDNTGIELWASNAAGCEFVPCNSPLPSFTVTDLGNGDYRWDVTGWSRECFGSSVWREGILVYAVELDGWPEYRWVSLACADGPQPIIDNVECSPLPIASTTWGAIKALYRSTGDMP